MTYLEDLPNGILCYEPNDTSGKEPEDGIFTATNGLANGEDAAFAVHHSEAAMREESGLIKRNFFSGDPDVIWSMMKAYGTEILDCDLVKDLDAARGHEIFGDE